MDNMGTNDEPNTNRTRPNPRMTATTPCSAKIVLRPDSRQRHVFTLEHTEEIGCRPVSSAPCP